MKKKKKKKKGGGGANGKNDYRKCSFSWARKKNKAIKNKQRN